MSKEEQSLFLEAMQEVTPLKPGKKVHAQTETSQSENAKQLLKNVKRKQRWHDAELNFSERKITLKTAAKVKSNEVLMFHQKGVRTQDLATLKKGNFRLQGLLDLHGYTEREAERRIIEFIHSNFNEKSRFLRIIHGKGYNSKSDYPVLKNLTNQLLRSLPEIIAFSSAAEKDGGLGAVNILLKAQ